MSKDNTIAERMLTLTSSSLSEESESEELDESESELELELESDDELLRRDASINNNICIKNRPGILKYTEVKIAL